MQPHDPFCDGLAEGQGEGGEQGTADGQAQGPNEDVVAPGDGDRGVRVQEERQKCTALVVGEGHYKILWGTLGLVGLGEDHWKEAREDSPNISGKCSQKRTIIVQLPVAGID